MKILIVSPVPPDSPKGNRVTSDRWRELLEELGHRVEVAGRYEDQECDLALVLHARKSAGSVERLRADRPALPVVVALTGTDIYGRGELFGDDGWAATLRSVELAHRLVALQPLAAEEVPEEQRDKLRVIYQSAEIPGPVPEPAEDAFEVCVIGHLRPLKDPFLTARASRLLPEGSRVRVLHLGAALTPEMEEEARREEAENPRYRWLGEVPREEALRRLAASRLMVVSSRHEGGANVVTEALAGGVPVLATRIPGNLGLLGPEYPGYFPVSDQRALASLIQRAEEDEGFYQRLLEHCRGLAPLVEPERERRVWARLIGELAADLPGTPEETP